MVTLKLKKKPASGPADAERAPLRGRPSGPRPTLAQAQVQRAEREARYQEQLRQRYGDRPPPSAARPQPPARPRPARDMRDDERQARPARPARPFEPQQQRPQQPPHQQQRPQPFDPDRIDPRTLAPNDLRHTLNRAEPAAPAPRERAPSRQPGPRNETRPGPRQDPRQDPRHASQRFDPRRNTRRDDDDDDEREDAPHAPGSLRLSKRMSELGIASRREADEWIAKGWVRVDDHVVSELGSRVMPGQRITVDAKAKFQQAQRVTVLINKPIGYVSGQAEDGYEPAFVLVQPQNQWAEDHSGTRFLKEHLRSLVPAGRLDIDSVGLLVLTQDGRVAKQLVGEDGDVEKEYLVRVEPLSGTALSDEGLTLLRHGLELDGEALKPAQVEWLNADQLRFVLREGKKRQIRRMCEAVGLKVVGLKRVRIGGVMLGDLPTGQWRYLRADESFV
jgi:23S rRNA pseudouridine2604 synthase